MMEYLDTNKNTPLVKLRVSDLEHIYLYSKLEYFNPTGSVKDRAAAFILKEALKRKIINQETTIIESSSGNFGIALAAYCKKYSLRFNVVIDPFISPINEMLLEKFGANVFKVTVPDSKGGYLLNRLEKVNKLISGISNSYWINQYGNPLNIKAYYSTLGNEICQEIQNIDYVFLGISSGGTIAGVSQKVKELNANIKVIAVDVKGSVIFGGEPSTRYIPGIGASKVPDNLKYAFIDDFIMVDEKETVENCHYLLKHFNIFAGGSSGSVMAGIKKYFKQNTVSKDMTVVTIFADRGERYINTIYNEQWCSKFIYQKTERQKKPSLELALT